MQIATLLFNSATQAGTVPANGWAHREIILGSDGSIGPCRVPYAVDYLGSKKHRISGILSIPLAPSHEFTGFDVPPNWGKAEAMIESTGNTSWNILRVLVTNVSDSNLAVAITNRSIGCETASRVQWDLHGGIPMEASVGPAWISSGKWVVFVLPLYADGKNCEGSVEISASGAIGGSYSQPLELRFPVQADGAFSFGDILPP